MVKLALCSRKEWSNGSRHRWRSRCDVLEKDRRSGISRKERICSRSSRGRKERDVAIKAAICFVYFDLEAKITCLDGHDMG